MSGVKLVAHERLILRDDLGHAGLYLLELALRQSLTAGQFDVVVEAVLDRRTDRELRPGVEVNDGLGQHVRG